MADALAGPAPRLVVAMMVSLLVVPGAIADEHDTRDDALDETFLSFLAEWDALVGDAELMTAGEVSGERGPAEVRKRPPDQGDDDNERT